MAPPLRMFSATAGTAIVLAAALGAPPPTRSQAPPTSAAATVTVAPDSVLSRFAPARALGAGVDGHEHGEISHIYTRANERAMRSAGLRPLSYRLRTELAVEAWHWSPRGSWSDSAHRRGYWTGSPQPEGHVGATYGYRLPRRGNTIDQANDNGYSRLDDGRTSTFWKSNPYLDPYYTHEGETWHKQWVLIDLGRPRSIDAARLDWAKPWARRVEVQYWPGSPDTLDPTYDPDTSRPDGWLPFTSSRFAGHAGPQTLRLASAPVRARFVRLLLARSSHRGPRGSRDVRDRLGFALRELDVGTLDHGRLHTYVRHGAGRRRQTVIYTSSTDPWHRAGDRDPNTEQPSFQTVLRSGLTSGQPLLTPVPTLYGTPPDAAAQLRYMHALRLPVRRTELGEEPDGQLSTPEDYAALYVQFARAVRRVDHRVEPGGPSLADARGDTSWTRRFVLQLRRRRSLGQLRFYSFEWYPFDNACAPPAPQIARAPALLAAVAQRQLTDGVPRRVPRLITEYGYSAFATRQMVDLPGALLNADTVGTFLAVGGRSAYLYGYEPDTLISELGCRSFGNLILFLADDTRQIRQPVAAYWETRLLTRVWTQPGVRRHALLASSSSDPLLGAYAVRRPDGHVAVLLVNRDPARTLTTHIGLGRLGAQPALDVSQLSSSNYRWHARGERGYASPDRPPIHSVSPTGDVLLPPWSVTVARTQAPVSAASPARAPARAGG